jgi:hypothetical protein
MPIQIIPKEEKRGPASQSILLYAAVFVLFVAGASFFIINSLLSRAEKNLESIMQENAVLDSSSASGLEREILGYKTKIDDFKKLLDNHNYVSRIFPLMERLAHPNVLFYSLQADMSASGVITVSGAGESFKAVQQQLMIFRNEKTLTDVKMSGVSFGTGGKIPFVFTLTLDPSVLKP